MKFERLVTAVAALFALCVFVGMHASVAGAEELRWKTVMGVKQTGDQVGVHSGALFGGAPWETLGGSADVNLKNGNVSFDVKGLILAVGSAFDTESDVHLGLTGLPIGTTGGITAVNGTLVCNVTGDQGPNSDSVDTPVTPLDAQGNAHFSGSFSGSVPSDCSTNTAFDDAFLIRIGSGPFAGTWIAFGAVLTSK
jgi:hypothetical protein